MVAITRFSAPPHIARRRATRTALLAVVALAVTLLVVPTATAREYHRTAAVTAAAKPGAGNAVTADAAERRRKKKKSRAALAAARVPVGFSPGFGVIDLPPARQAADFAVARRAGVTRVRLDVGWARIEQSPGTYNWADTDRMIRTARKAGLQVLGVVGYKPEWSAPLSTDAGRRAFAKFAGLAARRYRGGVVRSWELWNEPNRTIAWLDKPDPVAYARMVAAVSPAIRRATPHARIVIGAFSPADDTPDGNELSPMTFLSRFYAAGVPRRAFDAVSVHPYSYPALPSSNESWNTFFRMRAMHAIMRRAGDGGKKIWITEYGAPTGASDRSVAGGVQSRMITDAIRLARRLPYTGPVYLYALRDLSNAPADSEANFGLIGHNGQPKPAYYALRRLLRTAH